VHEDYGGINNSDLLTMLSDHLSSLKPPVPRPICLYLLFCCFNKAHLFRSPQPPIAADKGLLANYKLNVSDALNVLPKLSAGLDINVKFTGYQQPFLSFVSLHFLFFSFCCFVWGQH
jgi:hypothetical protein